MYEEGNVDIGYLTLNKIIGEVDCDIMLNQDCLY